MSRAPRPKWWPCAPAPNAPRTFAKLAAMPAPADGSRRNAFRGGRRGGGFARRRASPPRLRRRSVSVVAAWQSSATADCCAADLEPGMARQAA
jgi:hypothetical protein